MIDKNTLRKAISDYLKFYKGQRKKVQKRWILFPNFQRPSYKLNYILMWRTFNEIHIVIDDSETSWTSKIKSILNKRTNVTIHRVADNFVPGVVNTVRQCEYSNGLLNV